MNRLPILGRHNIRIPRHKMFHCTGQRGKGTMGWFYGFKPHFIVNYLGEIVVAKVTAGNVHTLNR
jgi:hypothetical protein